MEGAPSHWFPSPHWCPFVDRHRPDWVFLTSQQQRHQKGIPGRTVEPTVTVTALQPQTSRNYLNRLVEKGDALRVQAHMQHMHINSNHSSTNNATLEVLQIQIEMSQ